MEGYYIVVKKHLIRVGPVHKISHERTQEARDKGAKMVLEAVKEYLNKPKNYAMYTHEDLSQECIQNIREGNHDALVAAIRKLNSAHSPRYHGAFLSVIGLCALGGWHESVQLLERAPVDCFPYIKQERHGHPLALAASGGHEGILPEYNLCLVPYRYIASTADLFGQPKFKYTFTRHLASQPLGLSSKSYITFQSTLGENIKRFTNGFPIPSLCTICGHVVAAEVLKDSKKISSLASLPSSLFELVCQRIARSAHGCRVLVQLRDEFHAHAIPTSLWIDAIKRSEQRTREHTYKKYIGDPDHEQPLIDVFANEKKFVIEALDEFEENVAKFCPQPRNVGAPAIVSQAQFLQQFRAMTKGIFEGCDFSNVVVIGGSVVGALLPKIGQGDTQEVKNEGNAKRKEKGEEKEENEEEEKTKLTPEEEYYAKNSPFEASDIDLCIYGGDDVDFNAKLQYIYEHVKGVTGRDVDVITSNSQVVICSHFPFRHINIVLIKFRNLSHILTGVDIDCSAIAFDGTKLWATPRAQMALNRRWTIVDEDLHKIRGSPNYETRLMKYAQRGFTIIDRFYNEYEYNGIENEWNSKDSCYDIQEMYFGAALVAQMERYPDVLRAANTAAGRTSLPYGPNIGDNEMGEFLYEIMDRSDTGYGPSPSCPQAITPDLIPTLRTHAEYEMDVHRWYGLLTKKTT